jgi:hypothetical protein
LFKRYKVTDSVEEIRDADIAQIEFADNFRQLEESSRGEDVDMSVRLGLALGAVLREK